jgi:hypothetical protein
MPNSSVSHIVAPLRSATRAAASAVSAAQDDLIQGAGKARGHISSGLKRSLRDVGESNERLQIALQNIGGAAKASSLQAVEQANDVFNSAANQFTRARERLAAEMSKRQPAKRLKSSGTQVKLWAERNPHVVVATVAVACYLLVRRYRNRKRSAHSNGAGEATPGKGRDAVLGAESAN